MRTGEEKGSRGGLGWAGGWAGGLGWAGGGLGSNKAKI